MIAEHDPWDIQLLRLYAERVGYQVVQVFQTQDVLPVAKQARPEIIIVDSELPGTLSSLEAVHSLTTDPDTGSAAVLLLSVLAELSLEGANSDIQASLQKPVTYGAFLQALTEAGVRTDHSLQGRSCQEGR
jgi:CheY-like chemotaxis protein